tara:strand:+ start:4508 stop:4717 length:210 start_codon:yes stop_codon:yes gene_type:complete
MVNRAFRTGWAVVKEDYTHECNECGAEAEALVSHDELTTEDLICPNADVGCEGIMVPVRDFHSQRPSGY